MKTKTKLFLSTLLTAAVSLVTVDALAEQNTWTGAGGDNNWSNGANWSLGTVSDDDGAQFNAHGDVTVTVDTDITVAYVSESSNNVTFRYDEGATLTVTDIFYANSPCTVEIEGGTTTAGSLDARGGNFIISGGTVEVTSTATDSIKVEGGSSSFTVSGGAVTTAGGVSVASSGTLTVSNGGSLTVTGTLDVNNGSKVHILGGVTNIATLKTESSASFYVEGGTVVIGTLSQATNSGIEITDGSVEITTGTEGADGAYINVSGTGKLILDTAITGTTGGEGNLTISFTDSAQLVLNESLLAIIAESEEPYVLLQAETIVFGTETIGDSTEDLNGVIGNFVAEVDGYTLDWSYDSSRYAVCVTATPTIIPEPSMFGLMFGLGAIGLVATRRCRRKAA